MKYKEGLYFYSVAFIASFLKKVVRVREEGFKSGVKKG